MKKLLFILLAVIFLLPSCATIMSGTKKNLILVDLPKDLSVKNGTEELEIKDYSAASSPGGGNTTVVYKYPGVRLKLKSGTALTLKSGDKTSKVPVKARYAIGGLIFEAFYTLGVGTIVDIVTGAAKVPKERYIDVPAALNKTKPRQQKELKRVCMGIN